MADQRDLHDIEQVVPATFETDIADGDSRPWTCTFASDSGVVSSFF